MIEVERLQDRPANNVIVIPSIMAIPKCEPNPKLLSNTLSYCSYWCDKSRERKKTYPIPLSFQSDIGGSGDVLRLWSCIWLAHLLHDAIEACPMKSGTLTPIWKHKPVSKTEKQGNVWKVLCKLRKSCKVS